MASLLLFFIAAFNIFRCSVDAQIVKGIEFKSAEGFMRRNFKGKLDFEVYASSIQGTNRTILAYTLDGGAEIKLIHRGSHLVVEILEKENSEEICSQLYEDNSYFQFKLFWEDKVASMSIRTVQGEKLTGCRISLADYLKENSTLYIGDPLPSGRSFEGTIAWIDYVPSNFKIICFKSQRIDSSFQNQISEWEIKTEYNNKSTYFFKMCESVGTVAIISSNGIDGFNPIQGDFCDRMHGRFLEEEEIKGLDKDITIWTSTHCKVVDSLKRTVKTCFPDQAYFACFMRKEVYQIQIFTDYDKGNILLKDNLQFVYMHEDDKAYDFNYTYFSSCSQPKFSISYRENKWHIDFEDIRDGYELDSDIPFGKEKWQSKVSKGATHEILIDNCVDKYSCGDGTCYSIHQHCDRRIDCKNGGDEHRCNVPFDDYSDYGKLCCSEKIRGCKDDTIYVSFSPRIMNVNYKDEKITLTLTFHWRDHRVGLRQSRNNYQINGEHLPLNPSRDFLPGLGDRANISATKFWVTTRKGLSSQVDTATIWNSVTLEISFSSEFSVNLDPNNCYSKYKFNFPFTEMTTELGNLHLLHVTFQQLNPDIFFHIYKEIKLTYFLPSTLMCFVAYSTLYFKLDSFNERITVSSTALLTLAVMKAESTSEEFLYTGSTSINNIWLSLYIFYTGFIVLLNSFLHYLSSHFPRPCNLFNCLRRTGNCLFLRSRSYIINTISNINRDGAHSDTVSMTAVRSGDSTHARIQESPSINTSVAQPTEETIRPMDQGSDHPEDSIPIHGAHTHQSQPRLTQLAGNEARRPRCAERWINRAARVILLVLLSVAIYILNLEIIIYE